MVDSIEDARRTDPPFTGSERELHDAWLEYHRVTLRLKCEGLDDAALRARTVPSSLMSLHGLVRHMAEVERNWFRRVLGGEDLPGGIYWSDERPEGDFEMLDDDTFAADLAVWDGEVARAREIAAAHELDDTGVRRGESVSLRWIYGHMLEEYARHNGHADLIREILDGAVGE
jgi:uncharacterized damage-inducible protein DinB